MKISSIPAGLNLYYPENSVPNAVPAMLSCLSHSIFNYLNFNLLLYTNRLLGFILKFELS